MSYTGRVAQYCDSVKYAAVSTWAATTAQSPGDLIRPTAPSVTNERIYVCIVGGTTGSTQPTWDTSKGGKNTDGTVTWQEFTGEAAGNGDLTSTPNWNQVKNTNVSQGHVIKDVAGTHIFIASTANASTGNGAEPTWNTAAVGNTTVDSGVTWTYLGTGFSAWRAPHARIRNALASNWITNAGTALDCDFCYVAAEHAETTGATGLSWPSSVSQDQPISVLCVDQAGSLPPVAADLRTTATQTTTGANGQTVNGHLKVVYGINFVVGTSSGISWAIGENLVDKNFENCTFAFGSGAGSGAGYQFARARLTFRNCDFIFSNTGQGFNNVTGMCRFINCRIAPSGSVPATFLQSSSLGADFSFEGCDLSTLSGSLLYSNNSGACSNIVNFYDCKFPASYTLALYQGSNSCTGEKITVSRCKSSGDPVQFIYSERAGTLTHDKVVYRDQGASENGVAYSWNILTTSHSNMFSEYFDAPPLARNNTNTGTNVIATLYGVVNGAALPTDGEICFDLYYLGTSGNDQATIKTNRVADVLATTAAHSSDTSDWDNGLTARANSHVYSLGDIIKLASNPGRIFFCTTAGTSAGSEPGGYASAVDGGSVTDGTAVFRAGVRFKMTVTATSPQPQQAGLMYARMKIGKRSTTFYIDPFLSLT
jgi:hypothetical protein